MSNPTQFLVLEGTKKLHAKGFHSTILGLIEQKHIGEALAQSKNTGAELTHEQVLRVANETLPKGEHLQMEYAHTKDAVSGVPIRHLEGLSERLTMHAEHLEYMGVNALIAKIHGRSNMAQFAAQEHQVGEVYAQIIEAAKGLESMGLIPTRQHRALEKLTDEPNGPLQPFYRKAMAILAQREGQQERVSAGQR